MRELTVRSDRALEEIFWPLCHWRGAYVCPYTSIHRMPQAFNTYMAGLEESPTPVWSAPLPLASFLEEHHSAIRADLDDLLARGTTFRLGTDHQILAAGDWDEHALFNGTEGRSKSGCRRAPRTCRLLRSRAEIVGRPSREEEAREEGSPHMITFLRLAAGSRLSWHTGTSNERLTAHLGLIVPHACPRTCLTIAHGEGKRKNLSWQEGKAVVFDDAYFHSAVSTYRREDPNPGLLHALSERPAFESLRRQGQIRPVHFVCDLLAPGIGSVSDTNAAARAVGPVSCGL